MVYHMTNQPASQETHQLLVAVVACEAAAFANFYLVTSSLWYTLINNGNVLWQNVCLPGKIKSQKPTSK